MQQHLMQMQPLMAAYYPNNVTTDHIQQVLPSSPFSTYSPFSSPLTHHTYTHTYTCLCIYLCICVCDAFIHHHSCPLSALLRALLSQHCFVGLVLYATFRTGSLCCCFLVFLFTPFFIVSFCYRLRYFFHLPHTV